jgi:hypothetical protein
VTPYDEMNERIALTQAMKSELLLVAKHPERPVHYNDFEPNAPQQVRRRDLASGRARARESGA